MDGCLAGDGGVAVYHLHTLCCWGQQPRRRRAGRGGGGAAGESARGDEDETAGFASVNAAASDALLMRCMRRQLPFGEMCSLVNATWP
jgi:hypothetical protein